MFSNRCYYALLALLELAKRQDSGPVTIAQIARNQHIPPRFLEAILRQLKQGGFTVSQRGKDGGYLLSREAGEICVGDVIRHVEGPLLVEDATPLRDMPESSRKVFEELMTEACGALDAVYDQMTVKDLAAREQECTEQYVANYSI